MLNVIACLFFRKTLIYCQLKVPGLHGNASLGLAIGQHEELALYKKIQQTIGVLKNEEQYDSMKTRESIALLCGILLFLLKLA